MCGTWSFGIYFHPEIVNIIFFIYPFNDLSEISHDQLLGLDPDFEEDTVVKHQWHFKVSIANPIFWP